MKYFTKEVKIGLTGAVAIAALFIGLNFLKGINLFKSSNSYYIEFSDIKGLAKSGPVLANGYKIGTVRDILYNYQLPGHVLVEISVDESMRLPKGTKGTLVTEMLGGCNLNLLLGNPEDGITLRATPYRRRHQGADGQGRRHRPASGTNHGQSGHAADYIEYVGCQPEFTKHYGKRPKHYGQPEPEQPTTESASA